MTGTPGRSVRRVIGTVHALGESGIAFPSLAEGFDTVIASLDAARRGGRPTVMTPELTERALMTAAR